VLLRLITVEATESCRRTEDSGRGMARDGKTVNGVLAEGDNRNWSAREDPGEDGGRATCLCLVWPHFLRKQGTYPPYFWTRLERTSRRSVSPLGAQNNPLPWLFVSTVGVDFGKSRPVHRHSSKLQCSNCTQTLYSGNRLDKAVLWVYGFMVFRATVLSQNYDVLFRRFVIGTPPRRNGESIGRGDRSSE
jgi:hypothetical protein